MDGNVIRDDRECGKGLCMGRVNTVALDILSWKLLWDIHVKMFIWHLDKYGEDVLCRDIDLKVICV